MWEKVTGKISVRKVGKIMRNMVEGVGEVRGNKQRGSRGRKGKF